MNFNKKKLLQTGILIKNILRQIESTEEGLWDTKKIINNKIFTVSYLFYIVGHCEVWVDKQDVFWLQVCVRQLIIMKNCRKKKSLQYHMNLKIIKLNKNWQWNINYWVYLFKTDVFSMTYISQRDKLDRPCAWPDRSSTAGSCSPSGSRRCSEPTAQKKYTYDRGSQTSHTSVHTNCKTTYIMFYLFYLKGRK